MSVNDLKFKHPFTSIVSGMSGSGKTTFVERLLKNWESVILSDIKHLRILWCYSLDESLKNLFKDPFKNVTIVYHKGIPTMNEIGKYKPNLIVFDDLMDEVDDNVRLLFTRGARHLNFSVLLLVQNLFNQNKHMRTVNLNAQYIILTDDLSNLQHLKHICAQYFPGKLNQLYDIFNHAISNFGYLVIQKGPRAPFEYRFRTRIFREELIEDLSRRHSFCPIFYKLK